MTCAYCGAPLRAGAGFCAACGYKTTARPPATADALDVRRRTWIAYPIVAGAVLAIAAVVAVARPSGEPAATPRPTPSPTPDADRVALVPTDVGAFAVSFPDGWKQQRQTSEGRTAVLFADPASGPADRPGRGFDIIPETIGLEDARRRVVETVDRRSAGYREIRVQDGLEVSGRKAFRHEFFEDELRFDQWWIERPGGTLRLTFWWPQANADAPRLNDRILATLRVAG